MYPQQFEKLVQVLRKLPGVGWRNAEKLAFSLLDWPAAELHSLAQTIEKLPHQLHFCPTCGCLYQDDLQFLRWVKEKCSPVACDCHSKRGLRSRKLWHLQGVVPRFGGG